jgi:hypothetical protein
MDIKRFRKERMRALCTGIVRFATRRQL